jgi:hypothetical protein
VDAETIRAKAWLNEAAGAERSLRAFRREQEDGRALQLRRQSTVCWDGRGKRRFPEITFREHCHMALAQSPRDTFLANHSHASSTGNFEALQQCGFLVLSGVIFGAYLCCR